MKKILVTGANGSIGRTLCERMLGENLRVHGAVRPGKASLLPKGVEVILIDSIDGDTDWKNTFEGVNTVVHLAARVHVMKDSSSNPFAEYCKVNVNGTERLAHEAASANVKRFIYMSSVKVNGEGRPTPYNEEDIQKPQDNYSLSKWEAEKVLSNIAEETGMEIVILRSPLVYGPRVKANFLRLLKVAERGIPLPLASIDNRRSLIYLGNVVDAIITCIKHPRANGQTYLVSDGEDISTPKLVRLISKAMGKKARLFSFPPNILKTIGKITGRSAEIERLIGSLCVDSRKIRTMLGWNPPYTLEEGIRKTVLWYKKFGKGQRTDVRW
jgi:nucleoside-diphosphate-sugar epimerase